LSLCLQTAIIPKLEAILAVTSSATKAKECLLFESAKIIMEFAINADATNTKIRFLKAALYRIDLLSSSSCCRIPLQTKNQIYCIKIFLNQHVPLKWIENFVNYYLC
jgi:hypothetical protein